MTLAGIILLVLALTMAVATFIENDYGTLAAKVLVYNSWWFELLLLLFCINLTGGIIVNKLWQRKKYAVMAFHISFVIIIIGAAITRYIGYEGTMLIREGKTSDVILSQEPYIQIKAFENGKTIDFNKQVTLSAFSNNKFHTEIPTASGTAFFRLKEFIPNAAKTVIEDPSGYPVISVVISASREGRAEYLLSPGEVVSVNGNDIGFEANQQTGFNIKAMNDSIFFKANTSVVNTNMFSGISDTLPETVWHPLFPRQLYNFGSTSIVIKDYYPTASIRYIASDIKNANSSQNALIFNVQLNNVEKEIVTYGGAGYVSEPVTFSLSGLNFSITYGPREILLPFSLELIDFQLERYPGSNSPSSYASEVILVDEMKGIRKPYRIYMNNVLNYGGFRFFQSSYDNDEKGTILSVNHDYLGTLVTYIGYALLFLAMFLSFFEKTGRFRYLLKSSKKISTLTTVIFTTLVLFSFCVLTNEVAAQQSNSMNISEEHAASFGKLLVQDNGGRIKPVNTLSSEVLRKVSRKDHLNGFNSDQVLLGMLVNPSYWQTVPMVKISHPELKSLIGTEGSRASFLDFFDMSGQGFYKLREAVELAYRKTPAERTKFDNEVIKVDERVNICFMVYNGNVLRLFPVPSHPSNKWVTPDDFIADSSNEAYMFVKNILSMYYDSVKTAQQTLHWEPAETTLGYIKTYQNKYGGTLIPANSKIKMEISYNKTDIFKKLYQVYGVLGFILIVLLIITIMNPRYRFRVPVMVIFILLIIGFILQTYGLIARWYISGHAPWSNGYESLIYIGWAAMLAGLIFSGRSKMALGTTAILTSLILMVAHLSWMDPQITNLVPVLKSYWLVIHVAVITASYSFLGLGAIMAFINLLLMNMIHERNKENVNRKIKEMSNIIEMGLVIGLVLLTIGTFLGGIWANESWGRYWGWDPKETWALITILFYSFVLHMRMIPGFRGVFAFNFAFLITYGSVMMTYFGVNYYLSGLHSYAQGDPVPVPSFVYYTMAVITVVSVLGSINYRKFINKTN